MFVLSRGEKLEIEVFPAATDSRFLRAVSGKNLFYLLIIVVRIIKLMQHYDCVILCGLCGSSAIKLSDFRL